MVISELWYTKQLLITTILLIGQLCLVLLSKVLHVMRNSLFIYRLCRFRWLSAFSFRRKKNCFPIFQQVLLQKFIGEKKVLIDSRKHKIDQFAVFQLFAFNCDETLGERRWRRRRRHRRLGNDDWVFELSIDFYRRWGKQNFFFLWRAKYFESTLAIVVWLTMERRKKKKKYCFEIPLPSQ